MPASGRSPTDVTGFIPVTAPGDLGDQDRNEEETRGEGGCEKPGIVGCAPTRLVRLVDQAGSAAPELHRVGSDKGTRVAHREIFNSHLTMFNGRAGGWAPGVPKWDARASRISCAEFEIAMPPGMDGFQIIMLGNPPDCLRVSMKIVLSPAALDFKAGADGGI